jgi:hypothetical protein
MLMRVPGSSYIADSRWGSRRAGVPAVRETAKPVSTLELLRVRGPNGSRLQLKLVGLDVLEDAC